MYAVLMSNGYFLFLANDSLVDSRPGMRGGHQMCVDVLSGKDIFVSSVKIYGQTPFEITAFFYVFTSPAQNSI